MMLTVEERLAHCHQGTAWMGSLIKQQLTELADLLAASERSDAESLAMYRSARDRADLLQREIDEIKQTEFPRRVEKVADCVRYIWVYADPEAEGIDSETVETAEMLLAQYPELRKV